MTINLLEATMVDDKIHSCPVCSFKTKKINSLWEHFDVVHKEMIPNDSSARRVVFNLRNRYQIWYSGSCVMCKRSVGFNETTGRYYRYCSEACIKAARENFKKNMRKKYNKETLLNDANHQRKMMYNRKISGIYTFADGGQLPYVGSYEKDFLEFMDHILNMPSEEILPDFIEFPYEFEGNLLTYIPDFYLQSLNLIVEIKDGGANPNNHHKIQAVDKKKELAKEEAVRKDGRYNYIKLTDKNYTEFIIYLAKLKNASSPLVHIMEGANMPTLEHLVNEESNFNNMLYIVATKTVDGVYEQVYITDSIEFESLIGLNENGRFISTTPDKLSNTLLDVFVLEGDVAFPCKDVIKVVVAKRHKNLLEGLGVSSIDDIKANPIYGTYAENNRGLENIKFSNVINTMIEECVMGSITTDLMKAVTNGWNGGNVLFMVTESTNNGDNILYQNIVKPNLPSELIHARHYAKKIYAKVNVL